MPKKGLLPPFAPGPGMHAKPEWFAEKILVFGSTKAKHIDSAVIFDNALTCLAKKLSNQEKTLLGGGT